MRALRLDSLNVDQLRELDDLYRTTRDVRVRTRAQMILLVAEQGLAVSEIAAIVRESGETVRRWVHRYEAEGIDGLSDAPRSGKPAKAGTVYRERLVELVRRRHPIRAHRRVPQAADSAAATGYVAIGVRHKPGLGEPSISRPWSLT